MTKMPHEGVYTRLKQSNIHGIGVFAIEDIPEGAYVFAYDDNEIVWLHSDEISGLPTLIQKLYLDFAIVRGSELGCPKSFDALTPSWYLNHSDHPNIVADENYRFFALRPISEGEELTVNYHSYSDDVPDRLSLAAK